MASDDFSAVTVAFDAASYAKGATMKVTVTGQNKHTSDGAVTHHPGTADITVKGDSGATAVITSAPVDLVVTTVGGVTMEPVTIVSVTDTANRVYKIAPDGLSATAVA